jgi:hypothetical protein
MNMRTLIPLALLATLAACGAGTTAISGHWSQETGSTKEGMTLEFDPKSDSLMVHTAPDENGSHDHLHGTYTFDAQGSTVTVRCELVGKGKGDVWQGKLDGEHLALTAGATMLKFHRGGNPHEHDRK